jgi:hypothetical protein
MPEDLPVTKRINVMVGIARSKVVFILATFRFNFSFLPYIEMVFVVSFLL